jgi:hypothetical protein
MMERDCANCDYSGSSFACCCGDEDDNSSQHTHVVTVKSPPERTFTESEVKVMIEQAISKSEQKCRDYKQEMLSMMEAKQQGGAE